MVITSNFWNNGSIMFQKQNFHLIEMSVYTKEKDEAILLLQLRSEASGKILFSQLQDEAGGKIPFPQLRPEASGKIPLPQLQGETSGFVGVIVGVIVCGKFFFRLYKQYFLSVTERVIVGVIVE